MEQAITLYDFKANETNDLSVYKNEIVDVVGKNVGWWTVRNKYGESGQVPVTHLAAPVTDDPEIILRGKAVKSHKARTANETSIEEGTQVAVLDNSDDYWWFVGFDGQTGYIPKQIIQILKSNRSNAKEKEKEKDAFQFSFKEIAPAKALCDEEVTVLVSFQKQLPEQGQFVVVFKGDHCEKVVDGVRLNDFTIKAKTPKYYPAERTHVTINWKEASKPPQIIAKGIRFTFNSKLDVVHKILTTETDPMNFLCSSFQIEHGDLDNVDRILSGNLEKKIPGGVELIKSSRSALVQEEVFKKETPTLLHFAAYYNLKKLAKSLLRCPGASEAMSVKNCHGNGPVGVAQLKKHEEMEQLLQDHEISGNIEESYEEEYMCMEDCYAQYIKMGESSQPEYIVPDVWQHSAAQDGEELYEDMEGGNPNVRRHYDIPRPEGEDRFAHYDEEFDDNANKIEDDSAIQKQIDEYKVFGRMTEKEVQLALLMKRVKERYITQEQALEMARVLHLEPQPSAKSSAPKRKPRVQKRDSAPEVARKPQTLPRTMSTSSGSSVSSTGSTGSAASSGYTSDGMCRLPAKPSSGTRPFSYLSSQPPAVSPKKPVSPPPTHPRNPAARTPSDPPPPVPGRRKHRQ